MPPVIRIEEFFVFLISVLISVFQPSCGILRWYWLAHQMFPALSPHLSPTDRSDRTGVLWKPMPIKMIVISWPKLFIASITACSVRLSSALVMMISTCGLLVKRSRSMRWRCPPEVNASLADSRRITLWQTVDYKLIYVGDFGSALHGFLIHFLGAHTKGDVGRHTVVREVNLLWHSHSAATGGRWRW